MKSILAKTFNTEKEHKQRLNEKMEYEKMRHHEIKEHRKEVNDRKKEKDKILEKDMRNIENQAEEKLINVQEKRAQNS
jgi:hypothetical protein